MHLYRNIIQLMSTEKENKGNKLINSSFKASEGEASTSSGKEFHIEIILGKKEFMKALE